MAHITQYATKQQLLAAVDRNDAIMCRASKPTETSGEARKLLEKQETIMVTNRQGSFYATLSLSKNKLKVQ